MNKFNNYNNINSNNSSNNNNNDNNVLITYRLFPVAKAAQLSDHYPIEIQIAGNGECS